MTKSEAISILKESVFTEEYREAIATVVRAAESTITYRNKWAFDSQLTGGYYHNGCKAKKTLQPDAGAAYTYFKHQYRFCPDCGEPMIVEDE